jgi:hypothetical protein
MGNMDHSPLGAMFGGFLEGWGFFVGPLAALLIGVALAFLAAGVYRFDAGWIAAVAVLVPFFAIASVYAFLIGLGLFAAWMLFLLREAYRVEALLAACWLTTLQTFLMLCREPSVTFGVLDCLRAAGIIALLPAIGVSARLYARKRMRELEKQIEEDRRERLRLKNEKVTP